MHARGAPQWQSRRKISLGPVRRAHPASGATWNVQVVRGKMTTRCLWHACRALVLGMILMILGAGMATLGYYAEHLSIAQEIRGNATVRVKNESRGFHLNNFSYVGPIVMGFGGFIVVAACVMTFEARDSAAKVVPARFKLSTNSRTNSSSRRTKAATAGGSTAQLSNSMCQASQTNRWDNHLGVFRTSPGEPYPDRKALTAALVHFSRALGSPRKSITCSDERRVSRSGSVPNLSTVGQRTAAAQTIAASPILKTYSRHRGYRNSSLVQKATREKCGPFLHPGMLQHHRQALSVDEAGPYYQKAHGIEGHVVHAESSRTRDRTKRSDTARRHVLSRQKPIEKEEPHSPKNEPHRRKVSTPSEIANMFRRGSRCSSVTMESKDVQTDCVIPLDNRIGSRSPRSPRQGMIYQLSTPSVEREMKAQLSICSEPLGSSNRLLSCQSSLEPCLPEESPDQVEVDVQHASVTPAGGCSGLSENLTTGAKRPDTLILNCTQNTFNGVKSEKHKFLYRSNSSRTFKRPRPKMNPDFDQIYFISSNKDDDPYDSIEVIDERRRKNFNKFDSVEFHRSSSMIYGEYCSIEQSTIDNTTSTEINEIERQNQQQQPMDAARSLASSNVIETANEKPDNGNSQNRNDTSKKENEIIEKTVADSSHNNGNGKGYSELDQTTIIVQADIEDCGMRDC